MNSGYYDELNLSLEHLSMELAIIDNVVSLLKSYFTPAKDFFIQHTSVLTNFKDFNNNTREQIKLKEINYIQSNLSKINYIDYLNLKVRVPEGYNSTFNEGLDVFISCSEVQKKLVPEILNDYKIFISSIISNKDFQLNQKDITSKYDEAKKEVVNNFNKTKKLYKENSFEAQNILGNVIKRSSDMKELTDNFIKFENDFSSINIRQTKQSVDELKTYLDLLYDQIQNKKIENISLPNIKNIAQTTRVMGEIIELYSLLHFRMMVFFNAIVEFIDQFHTILKK